MPKVEIILQFAIESCISMDDLPIKDIYIYIYKYGNNVMFHSYVRLLPERTFS